ncbi:hypothetical protein PTTG_25986 [Puccinia triticina 1-1 BBBD Race 1]|uniref:Uncharacterized protein n=1 Tax=Puccinia triticina (isolate 1-1 / race 1 (BBBD)) TaxID=630390 RepID=A0A180GXK8_PUCT1|nr:hypothetical protein PTTG_25986 [Puccinia triticina 1-1 BBBD Race 1]WAR61418.1 hypothetical protein PtB15_12B103 [Puccinia triticina]
MCAAINSTLSAYRTLNSLILVLLGLIIGQCLCVPAFDGIRETHPNSFPALAKTVESDKYENPWSSSSMIELGDAMCGKRAGSDGGPSNSHRVPEATSALLGALESEVLDGTNSFGIAPEDTKAVHEATSALARHVSFTKAPTNANQLKESAGTGAVKKAGSDDAAASAFLNAIETIKTKILQTSKSKYFHVDELDADRKQMALDQLNDAIVKFLITSERHGLASRKWLEDVVNKEQGVQMIFNYLARRFPRLRDNIDVTNAYLTTDLVAALQESPFTAELKELFKYFTRAGWHRLERLHLSSQLSALRDSSKVVESVAKNGFPWRFMELTEPAALYSAGNPNYDDAIGVLMSSLLNWIANISRSAKSVSKSPPINELLSIKILHSMLRFLVRYHITEFSNGEKAFPKHFNVLMLQKYDEKISSFSDTLKAVYQHYGKTLKELGLLSELDQLLRKEVVNQMIYLTDVNNSNRLPIFSVLNKFELKHFPQLPHFDLMIKNMEDKLWVTHATHNLNSRLLHNALQEILLHPEKFINAS